MGTRGLGIPKAMLSNICFNEKQWHVLVFCNFHFLGNTEEHNLAEDLLTGGAVFCSLEKGAKFVKFHH